MNEIIRSLYRSSGRKVGYLLATRATLTKDIAGPVTIAWSRCRKGDVFHNLSGVELARSRVEFPDQPAGHIPYIVQSYLPNFVRRSMKFFHVPRAEIKINGHLNPREWSKLNASIDSYLEKEIPYDQTPIQG